MIIVRTELEIFLGPEINCSAKTNAAAFSQLQETYPIADLELHKPQLPAFLFAKPQPTGDMI